LTHIVEIYTTETTKLSLLLFATNKVMSTLFSTSKCMKDIVPNRYIKNRFEIQNRYCKKIIIA
jgi:hypothetical protein